MSKSMNKLNDDIINYMLNLELEQNISNIISSYKKQIKKEIANTLIEEKIKLLNTIAVTEHIDFEYLKNTYLTSKEILLNNSLNSETIFNNDSHNESILKKIEIDSEYYYYEPFENGKMYNKLSVNVGMYKNNEFIFY